MLPYAGVPLLEAVLWWLRRGGDPAETLLHGALLALGYLAAIGDLREKRIPNRLVATMLGVWILILVPQLFLRTEHGLWLLVNGLVGFLLAGVLFLVVYLVSRGGLGAGTSSSWPCQDSTWGWMFCPPCSMAPFSPPLRVCVCCWRRSWDGGTPYRWRPFCMQVCWR